MGFRRYTWVGNKLSVEDMSRLHTHKQLTGKTITRQVAEAVTLYLLRVEAEPEPREKGCRRGKK